MHALSVLDEENEKIIELGFITNGVTVFDESETWSSAMFN